VLELKKELSKLLAALGANKTLPLIDTDDTDKKKSKPLTTKDIHSTR
jgi:hypothetical protein